MLHLLFLLPCHLDGLRDVADDDDVAGREQEVVDDQRVADKVLLELRLCRVHRLRSQRLPRRPVGHRCRVQIRAAACLVRLKALIVISQSLR